MRRLVALAIAVSLVVPVWSPAPAAAAAPLRVGVVKTEVARNTRHYITGTWLNTDSYDVRIESMVTLLSREGWDVSVVGDSTLASVTALKQYDVLYMPRTLSLTPAQRQALLAYCAEGGGIVMSFGVSRWDNNSSYPLRYKPFLGMSYAPGVYTWPASSDALKPWEWGEVSEMYNVKFKNDPVMYGGWGTNAFPPSSHPILRDTQAQAGSLAMFGTLADHNEASLTLPGANNVTPLLTFNTRANGHSADDTENGNLAGWASEYYFGRLVYYAFELHDLALGGSNSSAATRKVAERMIVNSVKWAGTGQHFRFIEKRVVLSGRAWYARGKLYIDETITNPSNISLRGPLRVSVTNPSGRVVASGQAYNNLLPLPPGGSYTHRSYQFPVSPTRGQWKVTMTYQYYDRLRGGTATASRIMYVYSNGSTMTSTGFAPQQLLAGNLPVIGDRISGATRFDTSIQLSSRGWPSGVGSQGAVVLATGGNYPDALAAAPLAGKLDAPVLLVPPTGVSGALAGELKRLYSGRQSGTLWVVGGAGAVSNAAVQQAVSLLRSGGTTVEVKRVAGADRFATSAAIAREVGVRTSGTFAQTAFVVNGQNYPDALAIGAVAAAERVPIVLVQPAVVPAVSKQVLGELGVRHATILGGTGVVTPSVEAWLESAGHRKNGVGDGAANVDTRLGGATRYDTALAAVSYATQMADFSDDTLYFATGTNWPDALALAPLAGQKRFPMVLLHGAELGYSTSVADYLMRRQGDVPNMVFVGGAGAISDYVRGEARAAVGR